MSMYGVRAFPQVRKHLKKSRKPLFIEVPTRLRRQKLTDAPQIAGYAIPIVPSSVVYTFEDENKRNNDNRDMMTPFTFKIRPYLQEESGKYPREPLEINNRPWSKRENGVVCLILQCPYQNFPVRSEYKEIQSLCHRSNCHRLGVIDPGHFGKTATQQILKTSPSLDNFREGYNQKGLRLVFDPLSYNLMQKKSWSPNRNRFMLNLKRVGDMNFDFFKEKGYPFLVKKDNDNCGGGKVCSDGSCCWNRYRL